jgi:tetratricopeptide (TPR) repeat protein
LNLSPQHKRQKMLEAIVAIILELAERQPVLFILEDLHWTDPTTLELVDLLIDQTPTASLCVVLTCRPEFQPSWSHRSYLTEMTINRLSPSQIGQVATQVAGGKRLPEEVIVQLVERTDGVPLYVEEMAKSTLESGLLKESDGRYELTSAITSLSIPSTLQDSLMARLDRLVTAKGVAQYASVIGRQFSYELLQAVSGLNETMLHHEFVRLVETELIYQRGVIPKATYIFKHVLIQDAAYESLLRSTRQGYHRRIAEVLDERFPETAEIQPELLAHHFTEAGLAEMAVDWWQRAGDRARQQSAYSEAIAHLNKGLAVLRASPETATRINQELRLHLALGYTFIATKGEAAPEVWDTYTHLRELCAHEGEVGLRLATLHGLILLYIGQGEHCRAIEIGEEALLLAQHANNDSYLSQAHFVLGMPLLYHGVLRLSADHFSQSLSSNASHVYSRAQLSWALWMLGYPDQAQQQCEEALTLSLDADVRTQVITQLWAGFLYAARREWETVYEHTTRLVTLSTEVGLIKHVASGSIILGWCHTVLGQDQEGLVQLCQGVQDFHDTGGELFRPYWLARLAEAYAQMAQFKKALRIVNDAFAVMHTNEEYCHHAELHCLKGRLLLARSADNYTEAESCFHQALDIARQQEAKSWELRAATSLARLWKFQRKQQEAYDLLAPVYSWFTEGFDTADLIDAKALLDELA